MENSRQYGRRDGNIGRELETLRISKGNVWIKTNVINIKKVFDSFNNRVGMAKKNNQWIWT